MSKNHVFENALDNINETSGNYIDTFERVTEKRKAKRASGKNVVAIPAPTAPAEPEHEHEDVRPASETALAVDDPWTGRTLHLRENTLETYDDLVEVQRRRKRKKQLRAGEPATGQEVAQEIFRLGLEHFQNRYGK